MARKRQWFILFKCTFIVSCLVLVLGFVWTCISWFQSNPHGMWLMGPSEPLRKIYFETDGVLTQAWLDEQLDFSADATLMDINIFSLQQLLVDHGQTKHVVVDRIFPNSMKITVFEHVPIMRLVIMDAIGKKHLMMISEEGHVYSGVNYPKDMLARLPYLIEVTLDYKDAGFEKIQGIEQIAKLLRTARIQYPRLYADWKFISMKNFESNVSELGATLQVHTHSSGIIELSPVNFESQLQHLNAILHYAQNEVANRRWQPGTIERIDLTLSKPVLKMASVVRQQETAPRSRRY